MMRSSLDSQEVVGARGNPCGTSKLQRRKKSSPLIVQWNLEVVLKTEISDLI